MARKPCRLCKEPASPGSIFCDIHRAQARLFSATFGDDAPEDPSVAALKPEGEDKATGADDHAPEIRPPQDVATREPDAESEAESESESESGSETESEAEDDDARQRDPASQTNQPAVEKPAAAAPLQEDDAQLRELMREAFAGMVRQVRGGEEHRWPQLSLYYVDGKLLARAYYSVIPIADADDDRTKGYQLASKAVDEAISGDCAVWEAFTKTFYERREALRSRELLSVDLHLMTYADLVAINEHHKNHEIQNVAVFERDGDSFVSTTEENARARQRHDRW